MKAWFVLLAVLITSPAYANIQLDIDETIPNQTVLGKDGNYYTVEQQPQQNIKNQYVSILSQIDSENARLQDLNVQLLNIKKTLGIP